eukprot:m.286937 g.286937  ORF g.286937 m.286937 type:complete len:255 (-) comp15785_c0_seq1:1310-2074(-)
MIFRLVVNLACDVHKLLCLVMPRTLHPPHRQVRPPFSEFACVSVRTGAPCSAVLCSHAVSRCKSASSLQLSLPTHSMVFTLLCVHMCVREQCIAPKRTHLKKSSAASSAVSAAPSDPSTTTTPAASNAPSAPSTPSTAPTNGEEKDDAHKRRAVKRQGVKRRMSKRPSAQWQLRSEDINVSDTEEVDGVSFGFSSKPPYAALYNKFDAPQFLFACAKKLSNEKSVVLAASRQGYLPGAGLGTPTSAGAMPSTSA